MDKRELEKRTVILLEKTKKDIERYKEERKKLYNYYEENNNLEEWEKFLRYFEQIVE